MRDLFYKTLPWVLGIALGYMLFHPPGWLQALGPWKHLVNVGLVVMLLVSFVAVTIISGLPKEPELTPVSESALDPSLVHLAGRYRALGFAPVGPPVQVNVKPAAIMLGFVHESEPIYGSAFRTSTMPPKTGFDFVSILEGDRGGLTTGAERGGAALPAGDRSLRQVFPGAEVEQLLDRHREALVYVRERGLSWRPLSAEAFAVDFRTAMSLQRRTFLAAPLRGTLVTLWRSATGRVPFVGPLRHQKIAERQIQRLLTGM